MRKTILINLIFLSLLGCETNKSLVSKKTEKEKVNRIVDIQTGYQMREMQKGNINYYFLLNKKLDTVSIKTFDKKFTVNEGYKIGTKWKDVSKELTDSAYELFGFGYYVELKSGWNLVFCIGNTCTDSFPNENAEVVCIEKRMHERLKDQSSLFKN
ncbi:MAG: hypothetical protein RL705_503 [Bacteroidota bacterium]|jgi:hypothetical protein